MCSMVESSRDAGGPLLFLTITLPHSTSPEPHTETYATPPHARQSLSLPRLFAFPIPPSTVYPHSFPRAPAFRITVKEPSESVILQLIPDRCCAASFLQTAEPFLKPSQSQALLLSLSFAFTTVPCSVLTSHKQLAGYTAGAIVKYLVTRLLLASGSHPTVMVKYRSRVRRLRRSVG